MGSIPAEHPAWCDQQHAEGYPVHTLDVGDQDIELGETDLSIGLYQHGDGPARVWLCEHRHDNTTVTPLTPEQARTLGERSISAAGSVESQEYPHRARLGEGNSGPGGAP